MHRFSIALIAGAISVFLAAHGLQAATYYVATSGSDAWSGNLAEPNAAKTDGPFATLQRARDAVRALKAAGPLAGPVTVYLQGGVYRLDKTVEFTPEDSGAEKATITYAAAAGQRPVLSGGRPITGWQKGEGALWKAVVPAVKEDRWYFHQLFVNGQRRTRARTPNQGYLYTEGILAPFDHAKWSEPNILAKTGFLFREGDLRRWKNPEDVLIVVYHSWTTSIHFITALDLQERKVKLAPISAWPIGYWWEYNTRYHVENLFEALDQPGEWYLDRTTGILYYWPMPGEDMAKAEVIAPVVRQTLLAFKGQPAAKKYVEHLRFQGISFQHADCHLAPDMPLDQQGATERQSMIAAEGLRHGVFEDCELAHAGENGLWLDSGCCDNLVRRCHLHDLGGSGVFVGPKAFHGTPETAVERNVLDNNFIHDGSHVFRGSQGVWVGRASHNEVTHNEISDFHHLGISVGHSWGYAPTTAHHNLIAFNHVHHICNGYFSDGGGIYTLGISPGTVLRNNVVHDVVPTPLMPVGGTGIYHDEGSTGILAENNIVYNVGAGAYNQHYGRENVARNNIFAFGGRDPITCCRPEEHLSFTFEGNIVLSDAGQATASHFSPLNCRTEFKRNLYWDLSGKEPLFSGKSFAEWQKTGRDRDSKIADPQFLDAKNGDFRLKPTSPALAMGFRPIAPEQAGLYGDKDWVSGPSKVKRAPLPRLPLPPPPPPPRPLAEDFETTEPGRLPAVLHASPGDRPDAVSVVEGTAADGKRSLKFTKVPGLKHGFQPHVYFSSDRYRSGKIHFCCDVMGPAGQAAEYYVGLRDYTVPGREYADGPCIVVKPDGAVVAAGKSLTTIPPSQWARFDIQVVTSESGDGKTPKPYRLAITVAGKEQVFDGLPCDRPEFSRFTWFGFSSGGKPGGVFYVDNVRLELLK
jgi:hypothetical protein